MTLRSRTNPTSEQVYTIKSQESWIRFMVGEFSRNGRIKALLVISSWSFQCNTHECVLHNRFSLILVFTVGIKIHVTIGGAIAGPPPPIADLQSSSPKWYDEPKEVIGIFRRMEKRQERLLPIKYISKKKNYIPD